MTQGDRPYIVGIGAANIDLMGRGRADLVMEDSNPGFISMSVGGVTHNICENAVKMGAKARLITAVGDDDLGDIIRRDCREAGIDTEDFLLVHGESSSSYISIHRPNGEMAVALSDMRVLQCLSAEFLEGKAELLSRAGAIVMDTGLPEEVLDYVTAAYGERIPIFIDPVSTTYARKLQGKLRGYHMVKPNLLETEILAGMKIRSRRDLGEAAGRLLDQGLVRLVVSLGRDGVYYRDRDGLALHVTGKPAEKVVNTTGAGDAFMGGLVCALLRGDPIEKALAFAVAASRMAIAHRRTINPHINAGSVTAVIEKDEITVIRL